MTDRPSQPGIQIDPALVRELAMLLGETGLTEIEVEDGPRRVRVARQQTVMHGPAPVAMALPAVGAPAPAAALPAAPATQPPSSAPQSPAEVTAAFEGAEVPSPMVGTAYLFPEPGAPAFANVGDTVTEGATILIVEAMKVMNPITAPRTGRLTALFVDNGQPVEYGQPLFAIA